MQDISTNIDRVCQQGKNQMSSGNYETALCLFRNALEINPEDVTILYYVGLVFYKLSNSQEGLNYLEKALSICKDHIPSLTKRGVIKKTVYNGDLEGANVDFEAAISIPANTYDDWISRGCSFFELGNLDKAKKSNEKAIFINGDRHEAWMYQGIVFCHLSEKFQSEEGYFNEYFFHRAINCFSVALQINSNAYEVWMHRGIAFSKWSGEIQEEPSKIRENFDVAIENFNKAIEINPNSYEVWKHKGITLGNLCKTLNDLEQKRNLKLDQALLETMFDEAIRSFDKSIEINPNSYEVWKHKGITLSSFHKIINTMCEKLVQRSRGFKIQSIEGNSDFYKFAEYDTIALQYYSKVLDTLSDFVNRTSAKLEEIFKESINSFISAIKVAPDSCESWKYMGKTFSSSAKHKLAIKSYTNALKIDKDDYDTWFSVGISCSELNRLSTALSCYDYSIKMNDAPSNPSWKLRQNLLYKIRKLKTDFSLEIVRDSWVRVLNVLPDNTEAWDALGKSLYYECLSKRDDLLLQRAFKCFKKVVQIDSSQSDAWYHLGKILIHKKDKKNYTKRAILCFEKATSVDPGHSKAWFELGNSLSSSSNKKQLHKAINAYTKSVEGKGLSNKEKSDAWYQKGKIEKQLRWFTDALDSQEQAVDLDDKNFWAWNEKGNLVRYSQRISDVDRFEKAIECFKKAIECNPQFWRAWRNLGSVHYDAYKQLSHPIRKDHALKSWQNGLEKIQGGDAPGSATLHFCIGNLHYEGKCFDQAKEHYERARVFFEKIKNFLNSPEHGTNYLQLLQNLYNIYAYSKEDIQETKEINRRCRETFERLMGGSKDLEHKKKLASKFNKFTQETVNFYVESNQLVSALEIAEESKNACLTWLLSGWRKTKDINTPKWNGISTTVNERQALVYWYLSPVSLTTFIVYSGLECPIVIPNPFPFNQLEKLNEWIRTWKNDYSTNNKEKVAVPQQNQEGGSWRNKIKESLEKLKEILLISQIETELANVSNIQELILVPHRDLHLFPLDYLFEQKYVFSFLPSVQVGINLLEKQNTLKLKPKLKEKLLSIENPDSIQTNNDGSVTRFPSLTAAEAESELICRLYRQTTRLDKSQTTLQSVTAQLKKNHRVLHFTGHGYYDFRRPLQSALALSQADRLTMNEITKLDLKTYDLACLSACETAIAGNQTITTEYVGIVSAFLSAGVAKVVSTLWTVESVASAILMVEFHHRRLEGEPESQALREAKHWLRNASAAELRCWYQQQMDALLDDPNLLPLLRDHLEELDKMKEDYIPYENPYYWAAFTLTGL